ncbi:unnamed protein product [Ceratitis capitata]|uniref:(Mediterranean fruit fly) hypothetical protein n=1 Tax=Ceratitis capitata TaxID=7213 RepID=A0A811U2Z9_CERCA|nr:unnamed protein product [Ceratitis capitata]
MLMLNGANLEKKDKKFNADSSEVVNVAAVQSRARTITEDSNETLGVTQQQFAAIPNSAPCCDVKGSVIFGLNPHYFGPNSSSMAGFDLSDDKLAKVLNESQAGSSKYSSTEITDS